MRTFTASTTAPAGPEAVLDVLTDPDACRRWAPMPFDVSGLEDDRLRAGSRARVTGRLAGMTVGFDVDVRAACDRRLELTATGPVGFDVAYAVDPREDGSEVRASISVRSRGGLHGRVMAQATEALLAAGALQAAMGRIAREAVHVTC